VDPCKDLVDNGIEQMMNRESNVEYHHDQIDGTDFEPGQLLICIANRQGLQKGRIYKAEAVTWRRNVVTVTVRVADQAIAVCPAERQLRRTFLQVDVMGEDGTTARHSFLGFDDCLEWSESTGIPYEQFGNFRLVEADPEEGADPVIQSDDCR
jgi:hypothetical protein